MRILIGLEVIGVKTTDFDRQLLAPELIEATEDGVLLSFLGIDELKAYQQALMAAELAEEDELRNGIREKIDTELNKAVLENQVILKSSRLYAEALFNFIYDCDAHREDKRNILDTLVTDFAAVTNDWELEIAIQQATFELGVFMPDKRLTFRSYSQNSSDFDFNSLRDQLISDLNAKKLSLSY